MIRVLIADDEALIRAGVRMVLETAGDIEVVAEVANGADAVERTRRHLVDVALLDIRMPVMDGLAAAERIAAAGRTRAIVLTTFGEQEYVARALRGGVTGFLLKDTPPDDLIRAVRGAAAGEAILSPRITRHVIETYVVDHRDPAGDARRRVATLTAREREVLALLGDGSSNADIARALMISEGTAKAHVSRILTGLGCANRVQAAILAHEAGLLRPA
ncbi:putative two-component system response regulator [Actinoplanes missouriensis 431]|uniref:Putative two-component system response regulator n=1 Tax=Actinoplanes missouriensis (strain ATCC 14538 / DSM 43046 / CBS 188.64 / JCM 3121 / NBRC 102363 / NCIMB 12654 / NRRL B-3342 / UNCC 431) TaxID=512565 RepID=I0H339_ACTM4|nr:response regulator transcription factor [Actinoplanes missouriensis]BAL87426.1 putative two-component system response regulator [Actinoplanes missouriensis 431]